MDQSYSSVYIKNNTAYIKEEESYVINNIYKYIENKNNTSFETNPIVFGINRYLEDIKPLDNGAIPKFIIFFLASDSWLISKVT